MANYRDRLLKSSAEAYAAGDFSLCFMCHSELSISGSSSTERGSYTNFRYHQLHIRNLTGSGSGGTDIDTAGAGQGNAICAECHFRIHSTALANTVLDRSNGRLVNFAPDVTAFGGSGPTWASSGIGSGNCTLTCHGADHSPKEYTPYSGTTFTVAIAPPAPATFTAAGDTITYTFVVTNSGTSSLVGPVTVTDDHTTVTCKAGSLAVGETVTCSAVYTTTSADVTAGSVTNKATAHAGATTSNTTPTLTVLRVP